MPAPVPGLPVSYSSSNLAVATVSGNVVTIVGVGTAIITAGQSGNANYLTAPSIAQTLTVNSLTTTAVYGNSPIREWQQRQPGDGRHPPRRHHWIRCLGSAHP